MNNKQKLLLFLISSNPGIKDIYTLVKVFDRADFPSEISKDLKALVDNNSIFVSETFDNGTPNKYEITNDGKKYLENNFDDSETINYIKTMSNFDLLLNITKLYIEKKNSL